MAKLSFRDRFFTPRVARAITSPLGILLAGAGASVGILVGAPLAVAAGIGAAAWAGRVAVAVPRAPAGEQIDPAALNDPWRQFVAGAQKSQRRYKGAVRSARPGPLRDRLTEIGARVDDAVQESWRIAKQGQVIAEAAGEVDVSEAQRELDDIEKRLGGATPDPNSTIGGTVTALRAQLASAARMNATVTDARDRLRLLDARLDEAVARAIELSVQGGDVSDAGGLGDDIEGVVGDMEALRQGLEEADHPAAGTA
jgi:hypothetical protein